MSKNLTLTVLLLRLYHAIYTENDERYREYLPHVYRQRCFESFLYLLRILDEEAEGEDVGQAEAEIPARADLLWHPLVEHP